MWDIGLLALEPLECCPRQWDSIRVRVQWFPAPTPGTDGSNPCRFNTAVDPSDETLRRMLEPLPDDRASIDLRAQRPVNLQTGQLVLTGNIYTIQCSCSQEREDMLEALCARWRLQRTQFLAGAAGTENEYLDYEPQDAHVQWLGYLKPGQQLQVVDGNGRVVGV